MLELRVENGQAVGIVLGKMALTLQPALGRAVLKAANYAGGEIARTVIDEFPRGTGELARSFLPAKFVDASDELAAGALSDLVYADILDRGGTVKPKTAKALAIPISPQAKKRWPRDWPDGVLTLIVSKRGTPLLIEAKASRTILHYVLKQSVTIAPRHYVDAAAKRAEPQVHKILGESVKAALSQVQGGGISE